MDVMHVDPVAETKPGDEVTAPIAWGAIFAGAVVAAAATFVLWLLGSGLGLSIVSPWSNKGVGPTTFAVASAVWLITVQWLSAASGGALPAADRAYLAQLVGARTGRPAAEAEKRVSDVIAQFEHDTAIVRQADELKQEKAKELADQTRKAAIKTTLLAVLALIIGAFIASTATAIGGRSWDEAQNGSVAR